MHAAAHPLHAWAIERSRSRLSGAAPIGVNRRVDQQLGEEIALRVAAADLGDAMADGKQQIDDASAAYGSPRAPLPPG
jgi:hypothetical protein